MRVERVEMEKMLARADFLAGALAADVACSDFDSSFLAPIFFNLQKLTL